MNGDGLLRGFLNGILGDENGFLSKFFGGLFGG